MSRKNAVQFQEKELTVLMDLYVKNYAKYHGSFSAGGKVGKGVRETLHEAWADAVSSLGVAPRTKLQIEEKIKNERKKVQKFLMEEKARIRGTGGGRPVVAPLPSYLDPLLQLMTDTHEAGIPALMDTVEDRPEDEQRASAEATRRQSVRPADEPCSSAEAVVMQDVSQLFAPERKPVIRAEMETEDDEPVEQLEPAMQAKKSRKRTYAASAREALGTYSDARTALYLEEVKLAKLRQEEVVVTTEMRRKELEKLNLEIEVLKAKKHFFEASRSPTRQPYPYAYGPPGPAPGPPPPPASYPYYNV